ncbi:hypothetical protein MtrunA17_Chr8g0371551 [Medicago truncatula]|uniref:Uncharacterized protein n=1 Tax=Medicago truncatula TaxID=3880 RepID=G7LB79_MEDTR|nr:uncharacterized protein LOC11444871 [Medicago truncatula]AET03752.1 hypothetical protein MTR_8g075290 [Medicago truncatula]RHN41952.1 hypothetical protein MtrunA17_Chr8g0371551 [Medicago truncatula]
MKDEQELNYKKEAAADTLYSYSKFVIARMGSRTRPCDLRLHLMKEISGMPTSLINRETPHAAASPEAMGESSSSGTARLDKADSFRAI